MYEIEKMKAIKENSELKKFNIVFFLIIPQNFGSNRSP